MRSVKAASGYRAQIYGVWRKGKLVAIGADGSSQAGVPATPRMHFRAGNSGESMLVTALYRLAEKGKVRLSTPVSRWYPQLPNASSVTLRMLADSLSGYNDFVTTEPFVINYFGDPFRLWSVPELLGYAFSKPPLFAPGTSWAFSDTNFVLLGDIVGRIAHEPSEKAIKQLVLDPLGLNHTRLSPFADLPSPVLHAYTTQRDVYEDSTFWSTSVGRGAFDIYSTVRDLGQWARLRAKGTLLTPASRRKFFAPDTAGLGPMTPQHFFASATIRDSGWIFNNPQISGYTVFVADHVPSDTSVVVVATANPANNPSAHFATLGFQRLAQLLTPRHVPQLNPCPRGC
jgi:D-alanyl-D-alanine carboxypeptidase